MQRIPGKLRSTLALVVPAALLAAGLLAGPVRSAEWSWRTPLLSEVRELTSLEPVRALPRTEAVLATLEAQRHLDGGRPYAAWETLRRHLEVDGAVGVAVNLLAARAAIGWGGWAEAKRVLLDRPWLESAGQGDGLLLLARAEEKLGNPANATRAYRQYLAVPTASERGVAHARLARLLSDRGEHVEAAREYAAAAAELPAIADWMKVLQVQALVLGGDPTVTTVATSITGGASVVRQRRVQLEAKGWALEADTARAIDRLEWEARILNAGGARAEAALLHLDRTALYLASGREAAGRELLAQVAGDEGVSPEVRLDAAQRLGELGGRSAAEELARAAAYQAAARPGLAARALRAALDQGAPDDASQRLRLAKLLYDERDYATARAAFQRAAEMLADPSAKAEAELYAARSLFRIGGSARVVQAAKQNAVAEFRRVVDRYEGTGAAGTALFLLGDEAPTTQAGLALYRRAAAIPQAPEAREALFRVGDRSLRLRDTAGAIRAWEEYVARYPRGEETARVAYEVGKIHAAAGRRAESRALYVASMQADPSSYYALRAGERLGANPLDAVLAEPRPWIGLASEGPAAAAVLERMDQLRALGLEVERDAEYRASLRLFAGRPLALITLAEGVRERNEPVEAIRLGRALLQQRNGEWDERLLRVVFPFPYRQLLVAEAKRAGIDPMLYAALVRQESSFRADARSPVGATGLGQIMPATGRWLAPMVGIRDYQESLLQVPEVNLRMGTRYLGDLLKRYNGAADLALAGYNAGPGRADRWRRELNYGRDTDAFREAIPYAETRGYVMIVLRNRAIYERLYGSASAD